MNPAVRSSLAVLVGAAVAFSLVAVIESLGQLVYPAPPGMDFSNPEQLRDYVRRVPLGALLIVLAAWVIATFTGGLVAARIAKARPVLFAGIVGALVLAATIANLLTLPHPAWFVVTGIAGILLATYAAGKVAAARS